MRVGTTFDVFPFDGLDSDVGVVALVVALEDVAVLPRADLALEDVVVHHLRHLNYC